MSQLLEIVAKDELYVEVDGRSYYRCQACRKAVKGSYTITKDGRTFHVECNPESETSLATASDAVKT